MWRVLRLFAWGSFFLMALALLIPIGVLMLQAFTARQPIFPDVRTRMDNIHHLGLNPADGLLYAATKRGLFKVVSPNAAYRITDSLQENAGFIIVGPDEFYASGKPDLRDLISDFEPDKLGLLHTTDAGHNWKSVSLKGEARFTTLVASHGQLYAFEEATRSLMVSTDRGSTWQTRGDPGASVLDFAVSPADSAFIIATTEQADLQSKDGGATWQPAPTPALRFVEWQPTGRLWGVDADGGVYLSPDAGASWNEVGNLPGEPEAFYATENDSGLYASTLYDGVFKSLDGGLTWQLVYQNPDETVS